jgi:hypothetical protein
MGFVVKEMEDEIFFCYKRTSLPGIDHDLIVTRNEIITIPFALIEAIKDREKSITIIGPNREWHLVIEDTCVNRTGLNNKDLEFKTGDFCTLCKVLYLIPKTYPTCPGIVECFKLRWEYFIENNFLENKEKL